MDKVLIQFQYRDGSYGKAHWWNMIDDLDELLEYQDQHISTCQREMIKLIKSDIPVNRWDHYIPTNGAVGLSSAIMTMKIKGVNPVYLLDDCINELHKAQLKSFLEHGNIILNGVGGWNYHSPEHTRILDREKGVQEDPLKSLYFVNKRTTWLNLENDPELESYVVNNLPKRDPNYSYVKSLRSFSDDRLKSIMEEFRNNGGQGLFIYTTGIDDKQMYEYTDLALLVGIKRFQFVFNTGMTWVLEDFLDQLREKADDVSVEIIRN